MMFPKTKKTARTRKTKKSIIQTKDGRCYLCMRLHGDHRIHGVTHTHHVYPGALRKISDENGFTVYLCPEHHVDGPKAVHNNQKNMRLIQKDCQRKYEETHTRQQFMDLTGRNYLD